MSTSSTKHYELRCVLCNAVNYEEETTTYCTSCGGVLRVHYHKEKTNYQFPIVHEMLDPLRTQPTELRFLEKLSDTYKAQIFGKCEFQNPTGCFKDRGSYIEVLKAIELKAEAICLASTGNMAASVAAYASYFNMPCYVFVPENTSEGKLAQATIYNARIIRVKGDYSTCEALCRKFAAHWKYYLAGDYVFREEGQKTMSHEILMQGGHDFDFILIPVGCGTNFGAIHKGLREAYDLGLIEKLPRLVAIQPEHSSPVIEGIMKKHKVIKAQVSTIAGAVAAADPVDFHKVQLGIQDTDGLAYTVTEEEILMSLSEMARTEGIFTEPACALPLAAIKNNPDVFSGKKCLLVLTGIGLKDTGVVTRFGIPSPTLAADIPQINKFIQSGYLEMQSSAWGKSHATLFGNLQLEPEQESILRGYVDTFSKRGKTLTDKEMEVLQSMVFNEQTNLVYPAKVVDYDIRMKKDGLVRASVTLDVQGELKTGDAKGVGPLHAVLLATRSVTDELIPLEVKNHNVEVLSPAASSLVVVSLTLSNPNGDYTVKSASPDTIEAGLNAFVKGLAMAYAHLKQA